MKNLPNMPALNENWEMKYLHMAYNSLKTNQKGVTLKSIKRWISSGTGIDLDNIKTFDQAWDLILVLLRQREYEV